MQVRHVAKYQLDILREAVADVRVDLVNFFINFHTPDEKRFRSG